LLTGTPTTIAQNPGVIQDNTSLNNQPAQAQQPEQPSGLSSSTILVIALVALGLVLAVGALLARRRV
jgi:hypothetical protein